MSAPRIRGGVILLGDDGLAAIERVRDGQGYHTFPGGGCESGEDPARAAIREAYEELGLAVRLDGLAATVYFGASEQHYFAAHVVGGVFGSGTGEEMHSTATSASGTYRAVWLPLANAVDADLRPKALAARMQRCAPPAALLASWIRDPVEIHEVR